MDAKNWEWLVTEKFLSDKFQGGKKDTSTDIAKICFATRQKKGKLVEPRDEEKYDEIVKAVQGNDSLSPIAFVDTCFGPKNRSKVFGFGGGMKRIEHLEAKLNEKKEESNDLRRRVEGIESMLTRMVNGTIQLQLNNHYVAMTSISSYSGH